MSIENNGRSLAILGFHKIGSPPKDWPSWFYVPEETFVRFLEELRDGGWEVLDVPRLLAGLERPEGLPQRAALLTFDDGYRSMRDVTLPCLQRFGHPGVLFVPTDYVGRLNCFDRGVEPEEAICDWEDLRELQRGGVSIQSHAASHRRLSELGPAEQDHELIRSKAVLEEHLGSRVDTIAFPYGDPGRSPQESATALKDAGYRAAFLYGGGTLRLPVADPYRLARLAMGPDTDLKAALEGAP